ncbi:hypothetical protein PLESTB_000687400 [Pleodorina starrii]|uniref:Uncharacterized protein n=3 Tax=Pleodorina starrii TaxID=330485 RepID=A0A9W6BJU4_9CHLO|nr:hypothetical protein PLESTB_000687400 [Pleodorina starrii]
MAKKKDKTKAVPKQPSFNIPEDDATPVVSGREPAAADHTNPLPGATPVAVTGTNSSPQGATKAKGSMPEAGIQPQTLPPQVAATIANASARRVWRTFIKKFADMKDIQLPANFTSLPAADLVAFAQSINMDPAAPAAALAAALNSQEQFGQAMQLQQQQQQQALAAGQDGRNVAPALDAAATAAGQPAAPGQPGVEAQQGLSQQALAQVHQVCTNVFQHAMGQIVTLMDARFAEFKASNANGNQAAAAAAAAGMAAAAAADAMEADGAGADGPSSDTSSEESDSSDDDDASPAGRIIKSTRKHILAELKKTDMRSGRERSKAMKGFAKTFASLLTPAQAAKMSASELVASWQERGNGYMRLHDWAPLSGAELDPRAYLSHLEFDMPRDADVQAALASLRSNGGAGGSNGGAGGSTAGGWQSQEKRKRSERSEDGDKKPPRCIHCAEEFPDGFPPSHLRKCDVFQRKLKAGLIKDGSRGKKADRKDGKR